MIPSRVVIGTLTKYLGEHFDAPFAPFHYEAIDICEQNRFVNVVGFRGSAKSLVITSALSACRAVFDKRPYIAVYRETKDAAEEGFEEITTVLEAMGSDIDFELKKSGDFGLYVIQEGAKSFIKYLSRGQTRRGSKRQLQRFSDIVLDDFDSFKSTESDILRRKAMLQLNGEIIKALDARRGRLINVGNYCHHDCVAANLMNDDRFVTYKIPALNDEDKSNWEDLHPTEVLKTEWATYKKNGQDTLWQMEMLCRIIDDSAAAFQRKNFEYYADKDELNFDAMRHYILGDLAIRGQKNNDMTVFVVVAVDNNNKMYIRDIAAGRWAAETDKAARELTSLIRKYPITKIGIEDKAHARSFKLVMDMLSKETGVIANIEFLKASNEEGAKQARILGLQTPFVQRLIYFYDKLNFLKDLEEQLLQYPMVKHDDIVDALSYILQFVHLIDFRKSETRPREVLNVRQRSW